MSTSDVLSLQHRARQELDARAAMTDYRLGRSTVLQLLNEPLARRLHTLGTAARAAHP